MTDEERSRLIAEFEGLFDDPKLRQHIKCLDDYAHDLNATMRAARRLLPKYRFDVSQNGTAQVVDWAKEDSEGNEMIFNFHFVKDDPARAAFLTLSDYLASREGK